jgi:RNA polymerase sigma-70 factor (ECF subfamily)
VFEAEFDYVWSSLRRLGVAPPLLEDRAHQTFLAAWRRLPEQGPTRPLRPWLFGLAFRVVLDPVNRAPPGDGGAEDERSSPGRRLVLRALFDVELGRRAVLVMHELDGHTMPQIAEALGIPLNTAHSRLRLARADLAVAVRRQHSQRAVTS